MITPVSSILFIYLFFCIFQGVWVFFSSSFLFCPWAFLWRLGGHGSLLAKHTLYVSLHFSGLYLCHIFGQPSASFMEGPITAKTSLLRYISHYPLRHNKQDEYKSKPNVGQQLEVCLEYVN